MISSKMTDALNDQITKEFYSAYLYLAMAGYFEEQTLQGFANWMRVQAQEETAHAMIFFNYVCEQGARPVLGQIDAPKADFSGPADVLEKTLAHEQLVTASISKIMDLAVEERDYASRQMLDWFIAEQVEEEASASTLLARIKRLGDNPSALELLDKELTARVFTLPAPLAAK